jgi:hypothetical protein
VEQAWHLPNETTDEPAVRAQASSAPGDGQSALPPEHRAGQRLDDRPRRARRTAGTGENRDLMPTGHHLGPEPADDLPHPARILVVRTVDRDPHDREAYSM